MKISTSILNASNRIDSVLSLNRTNTSYIHVDVMDGKFVDDIQFKINEISAVNRVSKYPLDVHLMVNDPIKYILELSDMNIEFITFHLEIRRSKEKIISKIKELGYKVGISINPSTDINKLKPYLKDIDMILVMSVEPGRGGQKFLESTMDRITQIKKMINDGCYNIKIEVDGGINNETINKLSDVDIAVVGSYIIKSDNYYKQIEILLRNNNKKNHSGDILYNIFILIGGILIFISACLDIGNSNYSFVDSISNNYIIYFIGFIFFVVGLFKKSFYKFNELGIDDTKVLDNKRKLYKCLLFIGMLPFLLLIGFWSTLLIIGECEFDFCVIGLFVSILKYWSIELFGFMIVVFSIISLSEIKKLSQK